jgi:hypothetical protein
MRPIHPIWGLTWPIMPSPACRNLPILRKIPPQKVSPLQGLEIALRRFRTGSGNDC